MIKLNVYRVLFSIVLSISWLGAPSPGADEPSQRAILGGIGAGKIEIGPDGHFGQITTQHNIHRPFIQPPGCLAAIRVTSDSGTIVKRLATDPSDPYAVKQTRVIPSFPFAEARYVDDALPVEARLRAFSPVLPADLDQSCYPAVVFEYTVRNPTGSRQQVAIALSWENLTGLGAVAEDEFSSRET